MSRVALGLQRKVKRRANVKFRWAENCLVRLFTLSTQGQQGKMGVHKCMVKEGDRSVDDSKGGNTTVRVLSGFILPFSLKDIKFIN